MDTLVAKTSLCNSIDNNRIPMHKSMATIRPTKYISSKNSSYGSTIRTTIYEDSWIALIIPLQKILMGSSTPKQDAVNLLHMPFQVENEWNPQAWVDSGKQRK